MATAKWGTVEELRTCIADYFVTGLIKDKYIKTGRETHTKVEERVFTYTGLSRALGFYTKNALEQAIVNEKGDIQILLMDAVSRIDEGYEASLGGTGNSGAVFALKNRGWDESNKIQISDLDTILSDIIK